MSAGTALRDAPSRFLDAEKWAELRSFANSDLIAVSYINAPYPDRENPSAFFCGREGSFKEALRCYELGREFVEDTRSQFVQRKLIAVGYAPDGERKIIAPLAWTNLWPMFVTNRACGRNNQYTEVEVYEAPPLESSDEKILLDCIAWLRVQTPEMVSQKKKTLIFHARKQLGGPLTEVIFSAAYKSVFGLKRGRRRISKKI